MYTTGDGCSTSYDDDNDTLCYDDYFINISRDGCTTSYDDDDDTLRYDDYFINISRDRYVTSYDDDTPAATMIFISLSRDGYTASYDDDNDTLCYDDYFINISRDKWNTMYENDTLFEKRYIPERDLPEVSRDRSGYIHVRVMTIYVPTPGGSEVYCILVPMGTALI